MKFFEAKTVFNYSWDQVAEGFWQRYPNPFSTHVLSEDTVFRQVDTSGRLKSLRLLTKTNLPPKWGEHVVSNRTVKIIEESIVDPKSKTLTTYTRNIGYTKVMSITEKVVYKQSKENPAQTVAERSAWIDSQLYGLSRPIQAFGLDRFKKNCVKAEKGYQIVLNTMFPGHELPALLQTQKPSVLAEQKEKLKESAKRATELAKAKARPVVAACQPEVE
ncbi:PRELI domain-containing protein 1, mitochondrial [Neocloeon triangulifer]|uniref:PRELI domain-containing protein 1, mitochondrial n=1 Tax=Neocloeon triangulifer TaxID=2078957 RepID=UPI00286F204A|nr:PRELI domain-containing protein 1, mitochondrial [Neocloeon triangulifer]XP_059490803.1 PRELI domain-containing protein 1, mitochondrial [Neocloeon triangulifer]XP_059490805.1 PRELI domain-containing protein 1, mitochondrial [Neocloeon triangulifer]